MFFQNLSDNLYCHNKIIKSSVHNSHINSSMQYLGKLADKLKMVRSLGWHLILPSLFVYGS